MKNVLTGLILLFAMNASAQDLNKTIEDPNRHKQVMLNLCTREAITSFAEFKASYDPNYAAYKPDSTAFTELSKLLKGKNVTIVLGTWCGDSKYQVPHFLKIMDALKVDENRITFIGVDGAKHAENGLIDSLKITNVPTFIFNDKKGKEVARITERPTETLEKDMLKVLAVKPKKTEAKSK
ncbi:thioredoxin family protein [Pedobacter polaris]|uniref:Thioredoxin family protein n=1 Tax=Pedobacter polaris TaxID=2571273 RepID=A0A4U1CU29_9SPHI|nr:thioredoxin family protein [Pedobacter polaris]TKC10620.1 thioredoxin family protein [Pedobacter polaris]